MVDSKVLLIELFIEDALSAKQIAQLHTFIQTDAKFKQDFISALRMHGLIKSASHADQDCETLTHIVNIAIGATERPGKFESETHFLLIM